MSESTARSGMKAQRDLLRELQDVDRQLREANERRAGIDRDVQQAREQLARRKEELNERAMDQTSFDVKLKEHELDLEQKEETVHRLMIQLNAAKSNKEYATLQHEIAGFRADASLLEDTILQMLEDADRNKHEGKTLIAEIQSREKEVAAIEQASAEESARCESEIEGLQEERRKLCAKIASDTLGLYERLLKNKDSLAVVAARDRSCTGCHMTLTHNTINHLMGDEVLVRCHSCGRILYLPQDTD